MLEGKFGADFLHLFNLGVFFWRFADILSILYIYVILFLLVMISSMIRMKATLIRRQF